MKLSLAKTKFFPFICQAWGRTYRVDWSGALLVYDKYWIILKFLFLGWGEVEGQNSSCWLYVSSDCSCWCVYSRLPGWGDRVAARGRVRMTQSASCQSCLPNAANLHGKTTHLPLFCRAKPTRSSQTPSTSLGSLQQVSVDALCAGFGACQWLARWN